MFSIADIQVDQEADFEEMEEGEESQDEQPIHSYPIRCSFAITKVRPIQMQKLESVLKAHITGFRPGRPYH